MRFAIHLLVLSNVTVLATTLRMIAQHQSCMASPKEDLIVVARLASVAVSSPESERGINCKWSLISFLGEPKMSIFVYTYLLHGIQTRVSYEVSQRGKRLY
jgi:hypothetical protein